MATISKNLFIIKALRMRRSLVKLSGLMESVTKVVTGCLRTTKFGFKLNMKNMGLCLYIFAILEFSKKISKF